MDYTTYKDLVAKEALQILKEEYNVHAVCVDTISKSYKKGASIEEAVNEAVSDTLFWEGGLV